MPDTTYLHIQGRESDPTRVLELPAAGVRIGRGAQCEVCLDDPEVSEVQCIVRRRGDGWHVQPVGPPGLISLQGRPVEHLRALPMGVPLQVGSSRLILRASEWETFEVPTESDLRTSSRRDAEPRRPTTPLGSPPRPASDEAEVERLRRWQARLEQRERWLQDRQDEKRWEARWKAAGEGLRARSKDASPPPVDREPTRRPEPERARTVAPRPSPTRSILPEAIEPPRASVPLPEPVELAIRKLALPSLGSLEIEREQSRRPIPPVEAVDIEPLVPAISATPAAEASAWVEAVSESVDTPSLCVEVAPPTFEVVEDEPASIAVVDEVRAVPLHPMAAEDRPAPRDESSLATDRRRAEVAEPPTIAAGISSPTTEFPSARAILAAQGTRSGVPSDARFRRRAQRRPIPTETIEPAQWTMPVWLGLPPVALGAIVLLAAGLFLGVTWAKDNLDAGLAVRAALRTEGGKPVPIDPAIRPEIRWWKTTAPHMAHWAAAIERSPDAASRAEEVSELLESARRAAPLTREIRHALASRSTGEFPITGLTRDVVSLTITGRGLKRAGKVEPAIRAYRRALELAADADPTRLAPPAFDSDPQVRRYRLPHEALASMVIRDILAAGDWPFSEWSRALPPRASARLAAARVLRETSSPDAGAAADLVLADDVSEPLPPLLAEHHAAQAEALAFRDRKAEAAERYRAAVGLASDDPTRRRWRLGLAEILANLGATRERAEMLEAAKGLDPNEEVTRKAFDAQKFAGLK